MATYDHSKVAHFIGELLAAFRHRPVHRNALPFVQVQTIWSMPQLGLSLTLSENMADILSSQKSVLLSM